MIFYLNVPYAEKDAASKLGAKWDGSKKRWFVPEGIDLEFFVRWISENDMALANEIIESQKPEKGLKLSNLLTKIKQAIENNMEGTYWVNAEIANMQSKGSTLYLQLAETDKNGNQICNNRAVIWGNNLDWIQKKFKMETGQEIQKGINILLKVKVEYSVKYQLSLVVEDVDPKFTLGGIEAKIKQIRDRMVALNLYNKNKSHKLPEYFRNIAVVSPEDAAGLGDFRSDADLLEKHGLCSFKYYTATFQGDRANKSVTNAIKKASYDASSEGFDAIVVIRGGGAKTDLHFLNEFDISRQIAECPLPVLVGIGHERDKVFLDEVANRSFDTPSKVVGYISNNNMNFIKSINKSYDDVINLQDRLIKEFKNQIESKTSEAKALSESIYLRAKESLNFTNNKINEAILIKKSEFKISMEELNSNCKMLSSNILNKYKNDLDFLMNDIKNNRSMVISSFKLNINNLNSEINMKSPLNALDNGYAIIKTPKGDIVTSIKKIEKEKSIIIMMKDGEKEFNTGETK